MKIPSDRDCVQLEFSLPAFLHRQATQTEEREREREKSTLTGNLKHLGKQLEEVLKRI